MCTISAIAIGKSKIFNLLESEDVMNAVRAVKKIGVSCIKKKIIMKFLALVLMVLN